MYCPQCGEDHHGEPVHGDVPPGDVIIEDNPPTSADVEIARIQANRDIQLAKISAGVASADQATELAREQGRNDGIGETLDRVAPEPEPPANPVIVDAPPMPDSEPDVIVDADPTPPPAGPAEPADDKPRKRGLGFW